MGGPTATLQARSYARFEDRHSGVVLEMDSFTCVHCGRVVIKHPQRQRPRHVCRLCLALTCDSPGCVTGCHPLQRDIERALRGGDQPWLLRHHGEPLDRIYGPHGEALLVLRRDNGQTVREMSRHRSSSA